MPNSWKKVLDHLSTSLKFRIFVINETPYLCLPDEKIPLSEIHQILEKFEAKGKLSQWPEYVESKRPEKWPSDEIYHYIHKELSPNGVDEDRVVGFLGSVWGFIEEVKDSRVTFSIAKKRRKELYRLEKGYQGRIRLLENDPILSGKVSNGLREYILKKVLIAIEYDKINCDKYSTTLPSLGMDKDPRTNLTKQGFWTYPMVQFFEYLYPLFGSKRKTHKVIAEILNLTFDCKFDEDLVRQRICSYKPLQNII